MIGRLVVVALFTLCMGASCNYRPNADYSLSVDPGVAEAFLDAWFRCDECMNGELRRVQELGDTAVPLLVGHLGGTVPNLEARRDILMDHCERIQARISSRSLVPAETCRQHVERYEKQLVSRYHDRSFEALLAIRTKTACKAIGMQYCEKIPPFPPERPGPDSKGSTHQQYLAL